MNLNEYRQNLLDDAIDRLERLENAIRRSPYDLTCCKCCDKLTIAQPDGLPVCNECVNHEEENGSTNEVPDCMHLLPCPFCRGTHIEYHETRNGFWGKTQCLDCGASISENISLQDQYGEGASKLAWNRRNGEMKGGKKIVVTKWTHPSADSWLILAGTPEETWSEASQYFENEPEAMQGELKIMDEDEFYKLPEFNG